MIVIAAIAYAFWAVLGFIFWIPLLVRVVAGFCGTLIYNMVINNPANIHNSKISLDLAISFYPKGFETIHSTLFEKNNAGYKSTSTEFHFMAFFGQLLWTLFFWALIILPLTKINLLTYLKTINYSKTKFVEEAERFLTVNDTSSAITMLSGAIRKDKFDPLNYYKRGMLHLGKSTFNKAVTDLETAVKLDTIGLGMNIDIVWDIARIYKVELNEPAKAIPYLTKTINLSPKFGFAYLLRGYCYQNLSKDELAIDDYNTTISIEPGRGTAYSNKGIILISRGERETACSLFEKAISLGVDEARELKSKHCN